MKKMVITEIEILDNEKYENWKDDVKIGTIFDETNYSFSQWRGSEELGFRYRLEDKTDNEWRNIPREYRIDYETKDGRKFWEILENEFDMDTRIRKLLHEDDFETVYHAIRQLDLEKENKVYGWITSW